ncbi:hypothetical protein SEA_VROOMVROOM_27 [Arthrobacter phage VroomVroom]|uniref:Uncharacterized protein n=1 Tax=Arthrobacter phage VroomVroom TaxID=3049371 RepID=A0AA49FAF9_9CAUD|nr:hypothetical protein SEA_VROOMVROOM_27 [Arthrobacter phage VroomVroom]
MTTTLEHLTEAQRAAVRALRRYLIDGKTEDLREVAENFVDARAYFYNKDGSPDWLGRTYAYRRWVRETTTMSNVPGNELSTVQAAIRYHAGNVLRERLDADQIEALGLKPESPRERSVAKRAAQSEILSVFGAGGPEITDAEEILSVAEMIQHALDRVSGEALALMATESRRKARRTLRAIADRADDLAEASGARRK